mmetsp:Transcript_4529/g.6640  ORF Transcript_4529/g.6640 Transcript_4529/m.6640 type:complete len:233 (-) Transcript_4529:283-981(-)
MARYESSFILTPRRKFEDQDLSLGLSLVDRMEDNSAPVLTPVSTTTGVPALSTFGEESFMSPLPTKYRTPNSPPSLCRERKRARHNMNTNAFRSEDGSVLPQFLFPDLDFDDVDLDLDRCRGEDDIRVQVQVPLRFRLHQRLVHPSTPTIEREDDLEVQVENRRRGIHFAPAPAPDSYQTTTTRTTAASDLNRSSFSSDKSTESIVIGIGLDSTSRSGRRMKRRSSSSALTA